MMLTMIVIAAAFVGAAALAGGVALFLRGGSDNPLEDRLSALTGSGRGGNTASPESSVLASPLDDMPSAFEEFSGKFMNLRAFLEQADVPLTPSKFALVTGGAGMAGCVVALLLPALGVAVHPGFAPLFGIVFAVCPFIYVFWKRKSRLNKFAKQLPEALELISRALRAGHSLGSGLSLVAEEIGAPLGKEFARCYEEQNFGIPLEEALEEMTQRIPNLDLQFFATAVILQRQTGGDLAEILDKIGHLVRERFKIYGQVAALTGEGRLSGIVLLALPPVLAVVMYRLNPEYVMLLFTDPMGNRMLAAACVMQFIGALVIKKIITIKV